MKEYIEAAKKEPGKFKMGGTGSKQEDQIITVAIEKATGTKFTYIPFRGGGEVAVQLVGKHVDLDRQQPDRSGGAMAGECGAAALRVRRQDAALHRQDRQQHVLGEVPTCKSQGLDVEYLMLRGIFTVPNATKDQIDYYVDLLKKVRETPEWKTLMSEGAFNNTFMTGDEYAKWVDTEEKRHQALDERKPASLPANDDCRREYPPTALEARWRVRTGSSDGPLMSEKFEAPAAPGRPNGRSKCGVAVAIAIFALVAIAGSVQVGIGWERKGRSAGFFPFYVGLMILASSIINFGAVVVGRTPTTRLFAEWGQLGKVMSMLVPTTIYVALVPWIGIYVASMLLIGVFRAMARPLRLGHDRRDRGGRAGGDLHHLRKMVPGAFAEGADRGTARILTRAAGSADRLE